jgi:Hint domain-containing protein
VNGDAVSVPIGSGVNSYDDISSLDLASLTLSNQSYVGVVGSELTVTTVAGSAESQLTADAHLAGAPVTVTVGTITASDAYFGAYGAGARFVDESTTDTGNFYYASDGGFFELSATAPVSTSFFEYNGVGTLALNDPGTINAFALEDLGAGDVLELPGTSVSEVSFGTNSLIVTTNDGSYDFTNVTYASGPTINSFTAAPDTSTGLEAITFAVCFYKGTLIRTPAGEVPIEKLSIGDTVATWRGGAAPIRWIGRQTVSIRFSDPSRILPIRIKAGALGDHVPSRDLLVSPDHAILVEDVLVQAGALVNGSSIVRETNVSETFTYYHVELDDHSLILAENIPAETFIDNVDRLSFDNWHEYEVLYPQGKTIVEMPYPRAKAQRQVPHVVRERLAARAAALFTAAEQFSCLKSPSSGTSTAPAEPMRIAAA